MLGVHGEHEAIQVSAPAASTSTRTGSGVDIKNYDGQLTFVLDNGTTSGTTPTLDGKIQDSADNSSFADVTGATFAQLTAAGIKTLVMEKNAFRRYIRYVGTIGGTTPSFTHGVTMIARKAIV